jgi:hypothetical protein
VPVEVLRPDEAISEGTWSIIGDGATLVTALNDDNDATYIRNDGIAVLDTEIAKVGLSDISLPENAKIFSVRVRIRVEQVVDPGSDGGGGGGTGGGGGDPRPSPRCFIYWIQRIIIDALTLNITKLFRDIFGFHCPRPKPPPPTDPPGTPPVVEWETLELAYFTQQPAGGEWTVDSFNGFVLGLGRDDAEDPAKISAVWVDVDWNAAPVGTATGPTGAIDFTTRPEVTWTYEDQESDRQQAWNVRVFNSGQFGATDFDPINSPAVAESGWTQGEDLAWTVNRDLVNGIYHAYVQVEQVWRGIGSHRSVPTFVEWEQAVPGPPNPHLSVLFDETYNKVELDLTEGGPTPETISYNIETSDNAGVTWELLRNGIQITVDENRSAVIYDYEAPLNLLRKYRAQAFRQLSTIKVASGYSNEVSIVPRVLVFWLKDPLAPDLNMVLPVLSDEPGRPRSVGVFTPLVADGLEARKITVTGPRYGVEGTMGLVFVGSDVTSGWDAFNTIVQSGRVLLWQKPTGEQHYISFLGDLTWEWDFRDDEMRYRIAKISYVEVIKPWNNLIKTI